MSDTIPTPRTNAFREKYKGDHAEAYSFMENLERELAELRAATAWRPISEAPKYENRCDILISSEHGSLCFVSRIEEDGHYLFDGEVFEPTHFMPLPKPPTL